MIHDSLKNWPQYFHASHWQRIFDFLASLSAATPDGTRIPVLGDDIYANIMTYQTGSAEASVLESHDDYFDVQVSLVSSEIINWFPRDAVAIKVPYVAEGDYTLYHRPALAPLQILNPPDFFTLLLPGDAHMTKIMAAGKPEMVKKVVVKVPRRLGL